MKNARNRIGKALLGLCIVALFAGPSWAATDKIVKVQVKGNKRLSAAAVLSYVKTRVGDAYSEKVLKDDQARLMASGRFATVLASVRRTPEGIIATFSVSERAVIGRLAILGNKAFTETELQKELPISQGDPMNKASVQTGKQALLNKYRSEGYHFAEVSVETKPLAKNEVVYRIVEGPQTIIKKVQFEGNNYFKNFSLEWFKIDTKAKKWPFITGQLNTEKIERDVITLKNLYVNEGFLDCEVGRKLDFSDDKRSVVVTFLIKEGPRYRINEVKFVGTKVFTDDELYKRLNLRQGKFFTQEVLRRDVKTLENAYGELGYIEAGVQSSKRFVSPNAPTPAWAKHIDGGKPALLNLVYNIEEKDQYRVGAIRIHGNSITQERVIRRELRFFPEQLCNKPAMDSSKTRLQQLRLFNEVTVTPVNTNKKGIKDVVIEVKEGRTAEFMVGVGVSSSAGLLGTVSLTQRNFDFMAFPKSFKHLTKPETFKGANQTLNVTVEPGTEMTRLNLGWSTPYIFDQPYSLNAKTYLFRRDYEHYEDTRLGVQAGVGHFFKNRWYGEMGFKLENVHIKSESNAAVEIQNDDGSHNMLSFSGKLVRDRTNNRWMPSEGDRLTFGVEQYFGDYSFTRFNVGYRNYKTLYIDALDRRHVLATRLQYGQIAGDAPTFERFYGGGLGSIRGFRYRGISPRGTYPGGAPHDDPIGGDLMLFAGAEYSFPLFSDKVRGVVFLDSGTVESDFKLTSYRVSVGAGLRIQIPFFGPVPMALDFGFPVMKEKEDETQVFTFSLGWTF